IVPQALGYVGVRAKDLGDWASYGVGLLGLQRIDRARSTLAFRMDDRKQPLVVCAARRGGGRLLGGGEADAWPPGPTSNNLFGSKIRSATGSSFSPVPRPQPNHSSPAAPSPASAPGHWG